MSIPHAISHSRPIGPLLFTFDMKAENVSPPYLIAIVSGIANMTPAIITSAIGQYQLSHVMLKLQI